MLLTFGILIIPVTIWTNVSTYAQQDPNKGTNGTSSVVLPTSTPPTKKVHALKMTSLINGQQFPVGSNLTVLGTSIDNASSSCDVGVTLNGIKPYQKAIPMAGANDYSKWKFTLSPNYGSIKAGENQIKAKFSCTDNPALVGYYSRNITGIGGTSSKPLNTPSNATR